MPGGGKAVATKARKRPPARGPAQKKQPAGQPDRPKVFCIGFHKTGTTSLKMALKTLGYRVTGPNGRRDTKIGQECRGVGAADRAEIRRLPGQSLADHLPLPRHGISRLEIHPVDAPDRQVDRAASPTISPRASRRCGSGSTVPAWRTRSATRTVYVARYERHNREVQEYFAGRSGRLHDLRSGRRRRLDEALRISWPSAHRSTPFPWRNSKEKRERRSGQAGARAGIAQGSPRSKLKRRSPQRSAPRRPARLVPADRPAATRFSPAPRRWLY